MSDYFLISGVTKVGVTRGIVLCKVMTFLAVVSSQPAQLPSSHVVLSTVLYKFSHKK